MENNRVGDTMQCMAKKKKVSGKHQTPRKPVQIPEDWYALLKRRATAKSFGIVVYYLIELVKKEAEEAGDDDIPPVPWAAPEGGS